MYEMLQALLEKAKGYKTIVFNAVIVFAGAAATLGWLDQSAVNAAMEHADKIWGSVLMSIGGFNIALRTITDSPIFKGK